MNTTEKHLKKPKWQLGALLPLGAALSTLAVAEPTPVVSADEDKALTLPSVKVKAARNKPNRFKAETSSTGNKFETPLRDIPQSINVIKQELIESQNAFNLRDALRNVSGLTIAAGEGGRTGDSITLRGFSANADTFLDGARENGQYNRDTFFLERVEALKGASSILFGRGATGGVINQIAKKPTGQTHALGNFTYGSFDFKRATLDAESSYEGIGGRINALYQDAGSFRDFNFTRRDGLAPSFQAKLGDDTDVNLNLLHQHEDSVFDYGVPIFRGRPADVPINTFYGFVDNRLFDTDVNIATAQFTHRFNDAFSVKNTTRHGDYEREYLTHLFGAVTDTGITSTIVRNQALRLSTQDTTYNQTDFTFKKPILGLQNTLAFGAEFGWEDFTFLSRNSTGVSAISIFNPVLTASSRGLATDFNGTLATNRNTQSQTYAGYVIDQLELAPEWKLLFGTRYDVFDAQQTDLLEGENFSRSDSQWSPRAGLTWQPTKAQSYYFSFGKSFNPSAETLTLTAANANLPPEQNNNYEIGAKLDFLEGRLSATAALFRLEKTNARTTDPNDPTFNILAGEQRTDGFELGLSGELLPRWDVSLTYAYLDAEVTRSNTTAVGTVSGIRQSLAGKTPINVPEHSGVAWTSYHITDNWEVGGGVYYATDRFTDNVNEVVLPGYARLDAVLAYHQKHYDVQVNIFNLADTVYYESGQTRSALPGVPLSAQATFTLKY
ncbi:MAG: TonB-dependent siderophore receptor [Methylomonas sp.]|nr:MAG: TonB-dependent siderophore receptor [Methylobacter sp.]PPD36237.1 MAG: TonB-dependent siderophore receptor [Methylomonas sp.]